MRGMLLTAVLALGAFGELPWGTGNTPAGSESVKERFEAQYSAWLEFRAASARSEDAGRSDVFPGPRIWNCEPFRKIVALGPQALPQIIQKIPEDHWAIAEAARRTTKWQCHLVEVAEPDAPGKRLIAVEEYPDIEGPGPPDAAQIWLRWWRENPKWTEQRFAKLYTEWQHLQQQGREEEAAKQYQAIKDLGIAALPYVVRKAEAGDAGVMAAASYLTDGTVDPQAEPRVFVRWWEEHKGDWIIPFPDMAERGAVPSAAPAQTKAAGEQAGPEGGGHTQPAQRPAPARPGG